MGLNDELTYALQEDNEEIFGDQSESTVSVNLAEDTIIKPGIQLPSQNPNGNSELFLSCKFTH